MAHLRFWAFPKFHELDLDQHLETMSYYQQQELQHLPCLLYLCPWMTWQQLGPLVATSWSQQSWSY